MVLDEPTASLDVRHEMELFELIREHRSVERALVQVRMPRMSSDELAEIVEKYGDERRTVIAQRQSLTAAAQRMLAAADGDLVRALLGHVHEDARVIGFREWFGADKSLLDRDYQVAGHTDNKPLKGGDFKDNWGLSTMRARSMRARRP